MAKIAECAAAGVDYIQLREKDLRGRELEMLAQRAMAALGGSRTRLLINSRTDVALACGAHGVHLAANDLAASEVRTIFGRAVFNRAVSSPVLSSPEKQARTGAGVPVISVSAHSEAEVAYAEAHGADLAVLAPVFEKGGAGNPAGLELLRRVCHSTHAASSPIPVFALGGVTLQNAQQCLQAGATGIAGIRLFQENDVSEVVKRLRDR